MFIDSLYIFSHCMIKIFEYQRHVNKENWYPLHIQNVDHIVELCKCKYSKFYVLKMFRYGSKEQRLFIMRAFHGKVCQLIRHTEASEVLEEAYNNHANAQERSALMEEFYGSRFAVFKVILLARVIGFSDLGHTPCTLYLVQSSS